MSDTFNVDDVLEGYLDHAERLLRLEQKDLADAILKLYRKRLDDMLAEAEPPTVGTPDKPADPTTTA